ncbi:MAG TPA: hypothetical protein VFQ38_23290 [Longimicrobiales bacterium]|nr:hypothetical protein [Longimicrobiales bacterium]
MAKKEERKGRPKDGEPGSGSGVGRREEVRGSGVYPASVGPENIPKDAVIRGQAEWGQGERGAAGYEDSGQSELNYTLEEAEAYRKALEEREKRKGESGS